MLRLLPVITATVLLLAYGVAEGLWTDRWGTSPELERCAAKIGQVPARIGTWEGQDDALDARQVERAELRGHLRRTYVQRGTGETLTVLLVCGRPGPVAAHAPQVCFGGAGFNLAAAAEKKTVQAPNVMGGADFWTGRFEKTEGVPKHFKAYWSWSASGNWVASESPRWEFASKKALYKLYVVRELTRSAESPEDDPVPAFLAEFLPVVNRCLFSEP